MLGKLVPVNKLVSLSSMVRSREKVFWNLVSGYRPGVELPLPTLWTCNNLSSIFSA